MGLWLVRWNGGAARAAEDPAEAELPREARLGTILKLAVGRNPAAREVDARARVAEAHVDVAGGLEDAQLKGEVWGVPLNHPASFERASTLMIGVRQALPAPGTRDARARVAQEDAGALRQTARARVAELVMQVRDAYAQYWLTQQELRLHSEHVDLLSRMVDVARGHYQAGRGSQQDLLRLGVELSRLHVDVNNLEQERRSNRALLNTLMGREVDAPLGPAPEAALEGAPATPDAPSAERPEVAAARCAVRRGEATLALARRQARWPSVMVGADYWYMPTAPDVNAYGAMLSIDLPWLNPRHAAEVREAEHSLAADQRALEGQRTTASYEVEDAAARATAAQASLRILDAELLPQARRSSESARAAYEAGDGSALEFLDAMRADLDATLDRTRALAHVAMSQAAYDRARGAAR